MLRKLVNVCCSFVFPLQCIIQLTFFTLLIFLIATSSPSIKGHQRKSKRFVIDFLFDISLAKPNYSKENTFLICKILGFE